MKLTDAQLETLAALALGDLDGAEAAEARAAVDASPELSAAYAALRGVLTEMRADDTVAPPREVAARAKSLMTHVSPTAPSLAASVRRFIASVVFDSLTHPPLAGVRGTGESRHILYHFEGGEIDLRVDAPAAPHAPGRVLTGQIDAAEAGALPARIELVGLDEGSPGVQATTDAAGYFRVPVPAGAYRIRATLGAGVEVEVPRVELL